MQTCYAAIWAETCNLPPELDFASVSNFAHMRAGSNAYDTIVQSLFIIFHADKATTQRSLFHSQSARPRGAHPF